MKIHVKGNLRDLLAFRGLGRKRKKQIARAPARANGPDPVNQLADRLHPDRQYLTIAEVVEETGSTRSFKLVPDAARSANGLAPFRAGQYLSLKVCAAGTAITRPYSIASAPYEALGSEGYYQITIRREPGGFLTRHLWEHWSEGTRIESSGPCGTFYYEPLRDAHKITGLAGGSGATPFRSMAREIVYGDLGAELLLLYGSSDEDDIVFYEEFKMLEEEAPDRIRVVHVLSCDEVTLAGCEQGFITAGTIRKYADVENSSFFICGPPAMYSFVEQELASLELPRRRIRREVFGTPKEIQGAPGYPQEAGDRTHQVTVRIGGARIQVPAQASEPVLVALERAHLQPPSQCRSGECGFCRAQLVSGEVYILPDSDGRRAADKKFGYFHPCASYPLSDLEINIPRDA
ncbi:MAG: iron-sulfur cluster-binding domain-containing protein [Anaerolineae bacterium]|jgi:ferredoxin-NADP reductase